MSRIDQRTNARQSGKSHRQRIISRLELSIAHAFMSWATVLLCFLYLVQFDRLENIGHFTQSPCVWIIILAEVGKHYINKHLFNIEADQKEVIPGVRKVPPPLTTFKKIKQLSRSIAFLILGIFIFALICILFGAPYLNQRNETVTLAVVLATLSIMPFTLYVGPKGTMLYLFFENYELSTKLQCGYLQVMHYNAVGALVGAWVASVVVPLDWDRPWQAYPIPNVCGAIIGSAFGALYSMVATIIRSRKREEQRAKANEQPNELKTE